MNTLKADFFTEEKVNLSLSNSEPKSVSPPSPRVLLTHCNVITLLVLILSSFLTITNNALSQPMKFFVCPYQFLFDGSNLHGGVYVLDLIFENERVQSIMILIK